MTVRTRLAPSPTGDPHVGTAYVALFNWIYARCHGGEFVLRIEDTDAVRSTAESEQRILDSLGWLGIRWDEGPDVGGAHGPYRQSENKTRYQQAATDLIERGHAFRCFCSAERLDELRSQQRAAGETTRYDGLCRALDPVDVERRVAGGEDHVVRMVVPDTGECTFEDELRGTISIPWAQIDMQVLLKSDGFPTYHLAVVVDDHDMRISHVIRGEDWINSTPKHVKLFEYFGWEKPVFCHLPLLRNPDQSKMSKRKNPTSITYYQQTGYLPEALCNYLLSMGWTMPDERDLFSVDDVVDVFDLGGISLGGPIFDLAKLGWMNGQYLRDLSADDFANRVRAWLLNSGRLESLIPLIQPRTERLADIVPQLDYLIGDRRPLSTEDFAHKALDVEACKRILDHVLRDMDRMRSWEREALYQSCNGLAAAMDVKFRDFLFPLFVALSGRGVSLPLFDSMVFLGPDVTRVRFREALDALGGVGKKVAKRFERSYAELDRDQ